MPGWSEARESLAIDAAKLPHSIGPVKKFVCAVLAFFRQNLPSILKRISFKEGPNTGVAWQLYSIVLLKRKTRTAEIFRGPVSGC